MSLDLEAALRANTILPVVTLEDAGDGPDLARALMAAGVRMIEVTLRTPAALAAIEAIARACPECLVGAGTVVSPADFKTAHAAGARFAVSPGLTQRLLECDRPSPWLAGVANASDIMVGLEAGLSLFKFFPAEAAGGPSALRAFSGPFPQVRFCPTGGVNASNLRTYQALENVIGVGGSWMIDARAVRERRWRDVSQAARAAIAA